MSYLCVSHKDKLEMRTKYILNIGNSEYELQDDDLENWDEIKCSFKRDSYGGVIRSFTSQFRFVNVAYDIIQNLYLTDGINASASIAVYVMDDYWRFVKRFECPLDFSSVSWDSGVLSINSVDNGLAALIKASKSTKYEFVVGADIISDKILQYDRIQMLESLTYGFTQGTSSESSSDIYIQIEKDMNPWVGNIGSEICVNRVIDWNDDQTSDPDSYLFKAIKDIDVSFDYDLSWRADYGESAVLELRVRRNEEDVPDAVTTEPWSTLPALIALPGNEEHSYVGTFTDSSSLIEAYPTPSARQYAIIAGIVWAPRVGAENIWTNTGKTQAEYFTRNARGKKKLTLIAGDEVYIKAGIASLKVANIRMVSSSMTFSWKSRGQAVNIPVITVETAANAILRRITEGKINASVSLSSFDKRLANTFIIAAEVARGISGAKFYSSLSDFCGWMEAVFGYVYYIGEVTIPKYQHIVRVAGINWTPKSLDESAFTGSYDASNVIYIPPMSTFVYRKSDGGYRKYWPGWENFNNSDGHPRTDTVFVISDDGVDGNYIFEEYEGRYLEPVPYLFDLSSVGNPEQIVYFVHRSELFSHSSKIRRIEECSGLKYSVDSTVLFSSVTAGYDKKDYDSINGRDEFNFNNTYSTGCAVTDKKLSLISKYRADCYGIEFAVQSMGNDTTDTSSDNDVFFIHCARSYDSYLIPDRTLPVENAINPDVFNAAYAPMYCIESNAGYIGLQKEGCRLQFASSEGNSDVVIGGVPMTTDIELSTSMASCGQIDFETNDISTPDDENQIIEVEDGGLIYRGYIKELDLIYSRSESAKYKLIAKEVCT